MARAAVELGVRELAEAAKVSTNTITRFERGEPLKERTQEALQRALEAAGVVFIPAGEQANGGPGVRLSITTATAADLTRKIDQLEQKLATPVEDGPPSPERALQKMDEARNQEITKRLKARRAKLKADPT